MSFNLDFLAKMGASFNTKVGSIYKYDGIEAGDDLATITATNYFLSRKASLRIRDMMEIVATDTNATYIVTALDPDVVLAEFASGQSDFITSVNGLNLFVNNGELDTIQDIAETATPIFASIVLALLGGTVGKIPFITNVNGLLGIGDGLDLFYDAATQSLAVATEDVTINLNGQVKNAGLIAQTSGGSDKFGLLSKYFGNPNSAAVTMAYARGSAASPLNPNAGDVISNMCSVGLTAAGVYSEAARIEVHAVVNFAVADAESDMVFLVTESGAVLASEVMRVTSKKTVGIGTANPNASALLDLTSTDKGLLLPRLNQTQIDAISPVVEGLMVFNTTTNEFNGLRDSGAGVVWVKFNTTDA